jgi:hypothetical protein
MDEIRIAGVFASLGVLDKKSQSLIYKHCLAGNSDEMGRSVARYLLGVGIASKEIPLNTGVQTDELTRRAQDACRRSAINYRDQGGILIAKGFSTVDVLSEMMSELWRRTFSPPIPVTKKWELTEEMQDRLTVVALQSSEVLTKAFVPIDYEGPVYLLPVSALEGVCSSLARKMYEALEEPNETIQKMVHGET